MKRYIFTLSTLLLLLVPAFAQTQPNTVKVVTFTIAASGSLSGAVDMSACTPARIVINQADSATGWTTANLTFQTLETGGTAYGNLYDQFGAEVTVSVPSGAGADPVTIILSPADWWVMRYMKIRSGTKDTPVTQAAERLIKVICR
jgi:hypothetical protein